MGKESVRVLDGLAAPAGEHLGSRDGTVGHGRREHDLMVDTPPGTQHWRRSLRRLARARMSDGSVGPGRVVTPGEGIDLVLAAGWVAIAEVEMLVRKGSIEQTGERRPAPVLQQHSADERVRPMPDA